MLIGTISCANTQTFVYSAQELDCLRHIRAYALNCVRAILRHHQLLDANADINSDVWHINFYITSLQQ